MRSTVLFVASLVVATASAFVVVEQQQTARATMQLDMASRRDFVHAAAAVGFSAVIPQAANAFSQQLDDHWAEQSQLPTDGRLDLNAAFVGDYMSLRGMYPNAAGKIASNGPYKTVKDIYSIPGLSNHDIEMFKQYDKYFTVNPPGRAFYERINARVST